MGAGYVQLFQLFLYGVVPGRKRAFTSRRIPAISPHIDTSHTWKKIVPHIESVKVSRFASQEK
jgi:hypothetical protein